MPIGPISANESLLREYQDIALHVRLIAEFDDNERHTGYRVETRKGCHFDPLSVERFPLSDHTPSITPVFNQALGCFKGHVLPVVDL